MFLIFLKLIDIIPHEKESYFEFKINKLLHNGADLHFEMAFSVEKIIYFYIESQILSVIQAFFESDGNEIDIKISKQNGIQIVNGKKCDIVIESLVINAPKYVQRPINLKAFRVIGHRGFGANKPRNVLQLRENTALSVEYAFKHCLKSVEIGTIATLLVFRCSAIKGQYICCVS